MSPLPTKKRAFLFIALISKSGAVQENKMKVMKFGGTSLANWQRFSMAADIVAKSSKLEPIATVLSAPATVTNALLEMVDVAVKGEDYSSVLQHVERAQSDSSHDLGESPSPLLLRRCSAHLLINYQVKAFIMRQPGA